MMRADPASMVESPATMVADPATIVTEVASVVADPAGGGGLRVGGLRVPGSTARPCVSRERDGEAGIII